MTIKQMAQQAIDVQSACNLSGVVASFRNIVESMRIEHGMHTEACNQHPVSRLFAAHVIELTRMGMADHDMYRAAYQWCSDEINGFHSEQENDHATL